MSGTIHVLVPLVKFGERGCKKSTCNFQWKLGSDTLPKVEKVTHVGKVIQNNMKREMKENNNFTQSQTTGLIVKNQIR